MPLYNWKCESCQKEEEVHRSFEEFDLPPDCPCCEAPNWKRVIGKTTFVLKGSGWYATGGY